LLDSSLDRLLERPMAPVDPQVLEAIDAGPIDPGDALPLNELGRLLEPGDLPAEVGWCRLEDGVGYTAVRTAMPDVTAEMFDWWFDWHPRDPLRYRIWFPRAHADISFDPAPVPEAKPYWNVTHHPLEDIGFGMQHLRIRFMNPTEFGFPPTALDDPGVATIVCGLVGDDRKHVWHTAMCHFARVADEGVVLRSRFWLGAELGPFSSSPITKPLRALMNAPMERRHLIPDRAARAMAEHCAAEYANLGSLLPELYSRYASSPASSPA
jgi:hypothetical protein